MVAPSRWTRSLEVSRLRRFLTAEYRHEQIAVVLFLVISIPILVVARGERSPWVLTTTPDEYPSALLNTQFGFNHIVGEEPFMAENVYYVDQVIAFAGYAGTISTYFPYRRALTPFVASVVAPMIGAIGGILAVNYLSWAGAAYLAWRFTLRLHEDKLASIIAVMLVSLGLGFITHLHDYSPHESSFCLYYLGIVWLYESRLWKEARPLRVHLFFGVLVALISINYSNGLYLIGAYILVSVWTNRWTHVAAAALIGASGQPLYTVNLELQSYYLNGTWPAPSISEYRYLSEALVQWAQMAGRPSDLMGAAAGGLSQFIGLEFPLLVFLGLLAWKGVIPSRRQLLLFCALFFTPILTMMLYLFRSGARGYVVYGISLLIYAPLAIVVARALRSPQRARRWAGGVALTITLAGQLFWSTGFLWGYLLPIKLFMNDGYAFQAWLPSFLGGVSRARILSLTGLEPLPRLFGGGATLRDAGMMVPGTSFVRVSSSWRWALATRVVIVVLLLLLVVLNRTSRRSRNRALTGVVAGLWLVPSLLSAFVASELPRPALGVVPLSGGMRLRYTIRLSEDFLAALEDCTKEPSRVAFFVLAPSPGYVEIRVPGQGEFAHCEQTDCVMPLASTHPTSDTVRALRSSGRVTVEIGASAGAVNQTGDGLTYGWQRNGLPNRTLILFPAAARRARETPPVLPAFEAWVTSTKGMLRCAGF